MKAYCNVDYQPSDWECFVYQLDAEDLEKEYLVLWDYTDQDIEFYGQVGFRYHYEAVIDGCDCVVVCQSENMEWLDYEWVDSFWIGNRRYEISK